MAIILNFNFENETETRAFSQQLAQCCKSIDSTIIIYLEGDLGAGKTTLAKYFIQTFGFKRVKSPTYSLVESYQNQHINIHHFDCYRLSNPEELEYIGIRDYLSDKHIQLIEWANLGQGTIAKADMIIALSGNNDQRQAIITSYTSVGEQLLNCVSAKS